MAYETHLEVNFFREKKKKDKTLISIKPQSKLETSFIHGPVTGSDRVSYLYLRWKLEYDFGLQKTILGRFVLKLRQRNSQDEGQGRETPSSKAMIAARVKTEMPGSGFLINGGVERGKVDVGAQRESSCCRGSTLPPRKGHHSETVVKRMGRGREGCEDCARHIFQPDWEISAGPGRVIWEVSAARGGVKVRVGHLSESPCAMNRPWRR